ncbi:hypothetical protein J1N35_022670 [Gossypium stocksii]|uniref:Uncharacterized protein n=1 Tax=Gossypium stocksii TaxID=47602 RepID=A0A9D3VJ01_9ROSI|nr:hypothetical protein J1N35_022670 [Gossypium stocksii]
MLKHRCVPSARPTASPMAITNRDYVVKAISANQDVLKEALGATMGEQIKKMTKSNDVLEALIVDLKEETEVMIEKIELEGVPVVCKAAVGKRDVGFSS